MDALGSIDAVYDEIQVMETSLIGANDIADTGSVLTRVDSRKQRARRDKLLHSSIQGSFGGVSNSR